MGGVKGVKHKNSISLTVLNKLSDMKIGDSVNKKEFILTMYDYHDWFVSRSFDVLYCKSKKELSGRAFKCKSKIITRIS